MDQINAGINREGSISVVEESGDPYSPFSTLLPQGRRINRQEASLCKRELVARKFTVQELTLGGVFDLVLSPREKLRAVFLQSPLSHSDLVL